MPFEVVKVKRGFKVKDDEGKFYSKKPLTKKMARKQQQALYAAENRKELITGSGYTYYRDDEGNEHVLIHGNGWFSNAFTKIKQVANNVATSFGNFFATPVLDATSSALAQGIRENYPPAARDTLARYGDGNVYDLKVIREPIQSYIDKALQVITLGRWKQAKESMNYDNLFHLSMIASLAMPNGDKAMIKIEKNEVINITDKFALKSDGVSSGVSQHGSGQDARFINVPVPCCITLAQMMKTAADAVGPSFFKYDAFNNNCQMFLANILRANGLLTPEVEAFVVQDAQSLLQQLPKYTRPFANTITNLAGFANKLMYGEGQDGMLGGAMVFNEERFKELQGLIPSEKKWLASYKRRKMEPPETYESYRAKVEDINRKRAMFDDEADARIAQAKEEARINNEAYAMAVRNNPDMEDVMCNYNEQGQRVKTRMTKGECRQANAVGFSEWERVNRPDNYYFFRPAVDTLAKTAGVLADVVPGVPGPLRQIGKQVAEAGLAANSYIPRERGSGNDVASTIFGNPVIKAVIKLDKESKENAKDMVRQKTSHKYIDASVLSGEEKKMLDTQMLRRIQLIMRGLQTVQSSGIGDWRKILKGFQDKENNALVSRLIQGILENAENAGEA
jgi:hypothetical protein